MNQKTNNRMQMLTAMAIFIAAVFIWGIVQWQATGVKEPAVQKALATQKKVNNVSDKKVNIEALTKILLQDIKYETKLNLMDDSVVEGIVSLQKDSKAALYMGEGTYSDEVLVVTASSEEKAKKDQGAVEQHLKEMKHSFEDYIPKQADKIENAVIIRCGKYFIACVTDDYETAQNKIVDAFEADK